LKGKNADKKSANRQANDNGVMINRRDFLKISGVIGAGTAVALYSFDIKNVLAAATTGQVHVVWLQGSSDTGCSISLLQGVSPDLIDAVTQFRLSIDFHPTLMVPTGDQAMTPLQQIIAGTLPLDVLIVEGAIPDGNYCTVGEANGQPVPIKTWVQQLGDKAKYIVAVGTCATYGGIPSGAPNPTHCQSVSQVLPGKTVVNIPGCPAHPDWVLLTLATVLGGTMPTLDALGRPTMFFGDVIHADCPRRTFYEANDFAQNPSDPGCLLKLGCRGPLTNADCRSRKWNSGLNYCIDAGAPCNGCTQPGFPDAPYAPFYKAQNK
jgi:hydrogenase small subunit